MADELDLAGELADIAAEISLKYFSRDPQVATKPDGTLVTVADTEIEAALRKRIGEAFPSHSVLGEEGGMAGEESAPTWVLDPIDGTNNFAWGIPVFGNLIALRIGGRTELSVVGAPALGERYHATRGGGAFMNGDRIHVSAVSGVENARVCFASWSEWVRAGLVDQWVAVLNRCKRSRGFGDFWGHMLVARGATEVMAEPELKIWDVAALDVIVEEAGGRITDFAGSPFDGRTCLTTNGNLHPEIIAALQTGPAAS